MRILETKQRIFELIKEAEEEFSQMETPLLDIDDYVAKYLTANGVIVSPTKEVSPRAEVAREIFGEIEEKFKTVNRILLNGVEYEPDGAPFRLLRQDEFEEIKKKYTEEDVKK